MEYYPNFVVFLLLFVLHTRFSINMTNVRFTFGVLVNTNIIWMYLFSYLWYRTNSGGTSVLYFSWAYGLYFWKVWDQRNMLDIHFIWIWCVEMILEPSEGKKCQKIHFKTWKSRIFCRQWNLHIFKIPWFRQIMAAHPFYVSFDHMICIFGKLRTRGAC